MHWRQREMCRLKYYNTQHSPASPSGGNQFRIIHRPSRRDWAPIIEIFCVSYFSSSFLHLPVGSGQSSQRTTDTDTLHLVPPPVCPVTQSQSQSTVKKGALSSELCNQLGFSTNMFSFLLVLLNLTIFSLGQGNQGGVYVISFHIQTKEMFWKENLILIIADSIPLRNVHFEFVNEMEDYLPPLNSDWEDFFSDLSHLLDILPSEDFIFWNLK